MKQSRHIPRQTRKESLLFGLVGLGFCYIFFSLAIDSGSLLQYAIAFGLLAVGARDLASALRFKSIKR